MNILTYLEKNKISVPEFAQAIKVSRVCINRYIKNQRNPRVEVAHRIVKATKGAVTLEDLYKKAKVVRP